MLNRIFITLGTLVLPMGRPTFLEAVLADLLISQMLCLQPFTDRFCASGNILPTDFLMADLEGRGGEGGCLVHMNPLILICENIC